MVLVHEPGGSGTFYYLAAALARRDGYCGLNAVLLGDRITLMDIAITDGLIEVRYLQRDFHEPMTTPPSKMRRLVVVLDNGRLVPIPVPPTGEQIVAGWVTIGHEGNRPMAASSAPVSAQSQRGASPLQANRSPGL